MCIYIYTGIYMYACIMYMHTYSHISTHIVYT